MLPARIVRLRGPLSFIVEFQDGHVRRRHVDHVCILYPDEPNWAQHGALKGPRIPRQEAEPREDKVSDQAVDDEVPAVEYLSQLLPCVDQLVTEDLQTDCFELKGRKCDVCGYYYSCRGYAVIIMCN